MPTQVTIVGLREFRSELRRMNRELGREMRQVHLKVAALVAGRAKSAAPGELAGAITPRATQKAAFIGVRPKPPYALGVFMGARGRFGWYSNPRYRGSAGRQFEPWVGNQWDPGDGGGAPYYIGPAINRSVDDVIELYGDEIDQLARRAFPS
jgi:hypothetical protein